MRKAQAAPSEVQRTKTWPHSSIQGATSHNRPVINDTSHRPANNEMLARPRKRAPALFQRKMPTPTPTTKGTTAHSRGTQNSQPSSSHCRPCTAICSQRPSASCNATGWFARKASLKTAHSARCKSKNCCNSSWRGNMEGASTATRLARLSCGAMVAVSRDADRIAMTRCVAWVRCETLSGCVGLKASTPWPCGSGAKRQPTLGSCRATNTVTSTANTMTAKANANKTPARAGVPPSGVDRDGITARSDKEP